MGACVVGSHQRSSKRCCPASGVLMAIQELTESTPHSSTQCFVGSSPIDPTSSRSIGNLHNLEINNLRQQPTLSPHLGFETLSTSINLSVHHELAHVDLKSIVKTCLAVLIILLDNQISIDSRRILVGARIYILPKMRWLRKAWRHILSKSSF
jgi:hypothetical protein